VIKASIFNRADVFIPQILAMGKAKC